MRIETLIPLRSREDVKQAIKAWISGASLTREEQDHVDLALRINAAEQADKSGFSSDRFEPLTIEVGA